MSSGRSRFTQQHARDGCCRSSRLTIRMIIARGKPSLKRKLLLRARNARRHCARLRGRHTRPPVKSKSFPQPTLLTPPVTRLLLHTFTPSPARTRSNMFSGRRFIKLLPLNLKRKRHRRWQRATQLGRKPRIPGSPKRPATLAAPASWARTLQRASE